MLAFLGFRRCVPDNLGRTSHDLLANFSLLFVPAGAGIILHAARLEAEALALIAALVGSPPRSPSRWLPWCSSASTG